jgi:flagellar biosynthesis protein FliP
LRLSLAIVAGIYTLSPLFTSKTVDEPLPGLNSEIKENMDFSKFMNLTEYERTRIAKNMTSQQIDNIMVIAAKYNSAVTEDMTGMDSSRINNTLTGFAGVGMDFMILVVRSKFLHLLMENQY